MNSVIAFALRRRGLVMVFLVAVLAAGIFAFIRLNIEAYPDPVPPLVEVVTQNTGQSAEEMERYITIPIEIQVAGIPHISSIRTISLFGLSDVKIQFTYDFSYDEAEQRVIGRLTQLGSLPNGAQPLISPESPIGEIYRYRLVGPPGYSVTDLKTLQDWVLERRFKAVPGVIDVTGWGGKTKTFDVNIDKAKLIANGLTLPQVVSVINNSNINVGGQTVNIGPQAAIVRGVGLIHSPDQLADTMIVANNGLPVRLRDIATIEVGHLPRLGIAGQDNDDDIVQGIVLMHRGEKSTPTIKGVEDEVKKINSSNILPPGVKIKTIYDRRNLINVTTDTVLHNMAEGIILIFIVQWLFLGNLRSAMIVAATIPFALCFAILIMTLRGESANLLSVGAIDFGLVVDATVIMVENVYRHLSRPIATAARTGVPHDPQARHDPRGGVGGEPGDLLLRRDHHHQLHSRCSPSPGVEGHIFGPMAKTYAYAIAGGLLATFTVTPALSALLMPRAVQERDTFLVRWPSPPLRAGSRVRTRQSHPHPGRDARCCWRVTVLAASSLGLEFLPHLEEGNFWIRAEMPAATSLEASNRFVNEMRRS